MKDTLIEFKTAQLAWNKDCKIRTNKLYTKEGKKTQRTFNSGSIHDYKGEYIYRPSQSLLQRYLREVHEIMVSALPTDKGMYYIYIHKRIVTEGYDLEAIKTNHKGEDFGIYDSYEKALEIGLYEALLLIQK